MHRLVRFSFLLLFGFFALSSCSGPQIKDRKVALTTPGYKVYLLDTRRAEKFSIYRPKRAEDSFFVIKLAFENATDKPITVAWTLVYLTDAKDKVIALPQVLEEATSFWESLKSTVRMSWGIDEAQLAPVDPGKVIAKEYGFVLNRSVFPSNIVLIKNPEEADKSKKKDVKNLELGKIKL
ncbi:putative lipoprotein [Leptospira fainei serovar Hurstbridge str. BUT 6]|uniref:Lipoprotein n=1 Tax=Leptospira fainei serovar Hurstbridge str. BUT 6 TaxID=1193011 RepID=S3VFK7_9LEPT|nr:hypothetical protein [Leptospira fainei]EPG75280.1 putative lipoprotein [Leptospira fainei serovar Hurstbridge str. BUT 6]